MGITTISAGSGRSAATRNPIVAMVVGHGTPNGGSRGNVSPVPMTALAPLYPPLKLFKNVDWGAVSAPGHHGDPRSALIACTASHGQPSYRRAPTPVRPVRPAACAPCSPLGDNRRCSRYSRRSGAKGCADGPTGRLRLRLRISKSISIRSTRGDVQNGTHLSIGRG